MYYLISIKENTVEKNFVASLACKLLMIKCIFDAALSGFQSPAFWRKSAIE